MYFHRAAIFLVSILIFLVQNIRGGDVTETIKILPAQDLNACYTFIAGLGIDKDPNHLFTLKDGILRIVGTARGYVATKAEYSNYHLIAEYKWGKESPENDSGIFVHCTGPDKDWMRSLEVQIATTPKTHSGDLILIGGTGLKPEGTEKIQRGGRIERKGGSNFEKPVGEWNTLEITCEGGRFEIKVNGQITVAGTDAEPKSGKIFLQSNKGTSGNLIFPGNAFAEHNREPSKGR